MFEHFLFGLLFLFPFAAVIFLPALIIGSVGAYRLRIAGEQHVSFQMLL